LGGVFAAMTTMAEVRTAHRDIPTVLDHYHWTVRTHAHRICTAGQRACAHMVLLVGTWLDVRSRRQFKVEVDSSQVVLRVITQLPPLPDELWMLVLGWLRRSDLGTTTW
jgi:hypothetical protein